MQKTLFLFAIFIILPSVNLLAQNSSIINKTVLSPADSVLLKQYKKGLQHTTLHSVDHQLYLDSILSIIPQSAYHWQQKAMPLFKQRKYEIGLAYLDSAVKYDQNNHYLEYRAFMKCIFQKTYSAAITDFEAAKKQKGFSFVMDHSYDFYMGLCYLQLNQFNKADSLIQSSVSWGEQNNNQAHYLEYFYSGIVQMEKKQDSSAIHYFNQSLNIYPQFPDAQFYKALCLDNLGRSEESKTVIAQGLADFNKGYSNNEDNSFYEDYPYQVRKYAFEQTAKYFNSDKK